MFDAELYYKTPKGREEIMYRNHHLLPRLRTALVLIDGKTPWIELKNYLVMLGEPERIVQQLAELGMIESDHQLPPLTLFSLTQPKEQTVEL